MPFFAFEGLSCSGKTTLISKLAKLLENKDVCVTSGLYDDRYSNGKSIKRVLDSGELDINSPVLTDMILTNKTLLFEKVIAPALKKKKIVLCDRWISSTFVYQQPDKKSYVFEEKIKSFMRNLEIRFKINPTPDLTFYLNMTKEVMGERLATRSIAYSHKDWLNWDNYEIFSNRYTLYNAFNTKFKTLTTNSSMADLVNEAIEGMNPIINASRLSGRCI